MKLPALYSKRLLSTFWGLTQKATSGLSVGAGLYHLHSCSYSTPPFYDFLRNITKSSSRP